MRALPWLLAVMALAVQAQATPRLGDLLPEFDIRDLEGRTHQSRELLVRPTILVVITNPDAGNAVRPWLDTAERRFGGSAVRIVSVLALDLPFFATWSLAAGRARDRTPRAAWGDTWLDRSGSLQQTLGLDPDAPVPYVIVLDATGSVRAIVHGEMDARSAQQLWSCVEPILATMTRSPGR